MSPISKKPNRSISQTAKNPRISAKAHAAFAKYASAKTALANFTLANKKLLENYSELAKNLKDATDDVEKAYLAEIDAIGPKYQGFSVSQKRKINVEGLLKAYPDAGVLVKTTYSLTLPELEAAVKEEILPEEAWNDFVVYGNPTINVPK